MSLAQFKTIFWWEYTHRLWGRLIGLVYLLPFLYFLVRRRIPQRLIIPLAGIFALGAAQGALGWYMVESGLAERVEVSQYRLVAHLALALSIYATTLWIALGLLAAPSPHPSLPRERGRVREGASAAWRRAAEAILGLVALTILAGGFVAGLHAGLTYNTFPLMDGSFVPAGYAQLRPFLRNWFENIAAVQFDHRLLATATFAAVLLFWLAQWRASATAPDAPRAACAARCGRSAIRAWRRDLALGRADPARRGAPGRRDLAADGGDRVPASLARARIGPSK